MLCSKIAALVAQRGDGYLKHCREEKRSLSAEKRKLLPVTSKEWPLFSVELCVSK